MRKQHPLFSPLGCGLALGLLAFIVLSLVLFGGILFSPGKLTAVASNNQPVGNVANHAEIENQCDRCHAPWQGPSDLRCIECHTEIETQEATGEGLHAGLPDTMTCADCHSDHQGRLFSSREQAIENFEHNWTGFSLVTHRQDYDQSPIQCTDCHGIGYSFRVRTCTDCHEQGEPAFMQDHVAEFGDDCLACHLGEAAIDVTAAHTAFPLEGGHGELECGDCHTAGRAFKDATSDCIECHEDPEIHRGQFGLDCAACHSIYDWADAELKEHTFPLRHELRQSEPTTTCDVCHPVKYVEYTCYSSGCHSEQEIVGEHREEGIQDYEDCMECHPTGREHEGRGREGDDDDDD